ncbi:hypothetical protein [Flavobacterium aestivum]|uniref:hypothetical protein n=1 Tax=Flavobacterium aestivum TaxID=3003257 RepID=UPI002285D5C4|nr:hypothetical protein [Flavobacterium aestivum]
MIKIIDNILPFLFIIAVVSFIVFIILGIGNKVYESGESNVIFFSKGNKYYRVSAILTISSFISIFSLSSFQSKLSRTEIKEKIEKIADKNYELIINDTIRKNDNLLIDIKNIKKETGQRNTGSLEINVKIKNRNETINLMLLRDFDIKTTYWVFYKNYASTTKNCIGEINTETLNEYQ